MKTDPEVVEAMLAYYRRGHGWRQQRAIVEGAREGYLEVRRVGGETRAYVTAKARERFG